MSDSTKTRNVVGKKKRRVKIDVSDVPPQPLILKNRLSHTAYKDNFRRRPVKEGSSKYTGAYFDKDNQKWKAQIMVDGIVRSIGYYTNEEEAAADYAKAAFKYKKSPKYTVYGGMDLSGIPEQPLITSNSASGYAGVKTNKARWEARISNGKGKAITLGTFDTPEEAAGIYARAKVYLNQSSKKKSQKV